MPIKSCVVTLTKAGYKMQKHRILDKTAVEIMQYIHDILEREKPSRFISGHRTSVNVEEYNEEGRRVHWKSASFFGIDPAPMMEHVKTIYHAKI